MVLVASVVDQMSVAMAPREQTYWEMVVAAQGPEALTTRVAARAGVARLS